jgi:hypothetical protein
MVCEYSASESFQKSKTDILSIGCSEAICAPLVLAIIASSLLLFATNLIAQAQQRYPAFAESLLARQNSQKIDQAYPQ